MHLDVTLIICKRYTVTQYTVVHVWTHAEDARGNHAMITYATRMQLICQSYSTNFNMHGIVLENVHTGERAPGTIFSRRRGLRPCHRHGSKAPLTILTR